MVEKRIAVIESNRNLALIERPECKRRWATEGWDKLVDRALRDWLLDRCEARELWYAPDENGNPQPRPLSIAQLADELRHDPDLVAVAELYDPGKDLAVVLAELIDTEHVPYLAALRYNDAGLTKRAEWENVWDLQREEDAAPDEPAKREIRKRIPVPPKYKPTTSARTASGAIAGSWTYPRSGSSPTSAPTATVTRRCCSAGPGGTTRSRRKRSPCWSYTGISRTAGPPNG